nr:leucine-rich repeat domain-containing protein [uncultured Carboxylicivirga sp.]
MKLTNTHLKLLILSIGLICTCHIYADPIDYTLTSSDVTIEDGIIIACSYDFSANVDGTNLIIPENLGITGVIDAEADGWPLVPVANDPFASKNIISLSLPSSMEKIGDFAFYGNNLTSIEFPQNLKYIGSDAFRDNNLSSLILPSSVLTIGSSCFYNNESLSEVTFADDSHLVKIGSHAFVYTSVYSITLPTPIVTDDNFEYWVALDNNNTTYQGGETISIGSFALIAKYIHTLNSEELEIEDGVITACNYNFLSKYITIPSEIEGQLITGIDDAENQRDGIFYGKGIREIKLPSSLKKIGQMAFNNNSISSITIPASVETIGNYAFWGVGLKTVSFAENCYLKEIGYGAFQNNSYALEIYFPSPIKEGYIFEYWKDDDDNTYNGGDALTTFATSYTAYFSVNTGVDDNSNIECEVYPNPVDANLFIKADGDYTFEITTVNGLLVKRSKGTGITQLNISDQAPGVYIIRVSDNLNSIVKRIVKK